MYDFGDSMMFYLAPDLDFWISSLPAPISRMCIKLAVDVHSLQRMNPSGMGCTNWSLLGLVLNAKSVFVETSLYKTITMQKRQREAVLTFLDITAFTDREAFSC